MENIRVSIIVPVYNTEEYIDKCIISLLEQELEEIEIILVDDGSTDNSFAVCKQYVKKYPGRIWLFSESNSGPSSAKNMGIEKARGEYLVFVDSDDFVNKNYVSDLYNMIQNSGADIAIMGYTVLYEKDNSTIDVLPQNKNKEVVNIADAIRIMGVDGVLNVDVSKIYKTEILKKQKVRFNTELSTGEDLVFNSDYLKCVKKAVLNCDSNYFYVRRENTSLVNKFREDLFDVSKFLISQVYSLYEHNMMYTNIDHINLISFKNDYMVSCVSNMYRKDSTMSGRGRRDVLRQIYDYLDDDFIIKNTRNDIFSKIFRNLYKLDNVLLSDILYNCLFYCRNHFTNLYIMFRNRVVYKKEQ